MRTQSKNNQRLKARENAADQVAIILSSESDWLRKWGEFSGPITEKKTKAISDYFDATNQTRPSWLWQVVTC